MLSVLIPIYRFDLRPLVRELHRQAQLLDIDWEIILFDDASGEPWRSRHQELGRLSGVVYREMPTNLGRAAIRNALARYARFEHLLFLDCDSAPEQPDYLWRYVRLLPYPGVVYGGRSYAPDPPADADYRTHWRYGREREVRKAAERSRRPYQGFMTNNFCIAKAVMLRLPFDERIRQYGHEDTLFGLQLQKAGIPVLHIDNPLRHVGLERTDHWLGKQERAIENLYRLQREYPELHTRALGLWRRLRGTGLLPLLFPLLQWLAPPAERRLRRPGASFRWLDLLKLYWLEGRAREASRSR